MTSKPNLERCYFALALVMAFVYFINLPFSPGTSTQELMDRFFGADCWRVLENLRDTVGVSHYRDKAHPYFSLFAVTLAKLGSVTGVNGAEFLLYRTVFGTIGVFLFWRLIFLETRKPLIAFSAVILLLSTFTVKVWSILPDTFIFGFFTLMLSLNLIRMNSGIAPVFIAALSGATTNAFLGIIYIARRFHSSLKELYEGIFCTTACIAILSMMQKMLYPSSIHFLNVYALQEERLYLNKSLASVPFRFFDFIYSGFVIPLPNKLGEDLLSDDLWSSFFSNIGHTHDKSLVAAILLALILASLLICFSLYTFWRNSERQELSKIILAFLIFQVILHMAYGDMPFLYSYHFLPMIILFMILQLPKSNFTVVALLVFSVVLQMVQIGQIDQFNQLFR